MPRSLLRRPQLLRSYHVLFEPPGSDGEEALVFISSLRRVRVTGRFFREFHEEVIPLLDGARSFDDIAAAVAESFAIDDLAAAIDLLAENGVLLDAADLDPMADENYRLEPQLNLFQAIGGAPALVQAKLARSTVAVVGLGGAGASVAMALAGCGIGQIRCLDDAEVGPADPYLAPFYNRKDLGMSRAHALAKRLLDVSPALSCTEVTGALADDAAVRSALDGCDFVVNCLDQGQLSLAYKLNRVCLELGTSSIFGAATGLEVRVGPLVVPGETACFMCYQMRLTACAQRPEEALRFQSYLDRRKRDDSARHENLACGPNICGQLLSLDTVKHLSGILEPSLRGRLFVLNLAQLTASTHHVLRKPWCPACSLLSPGLATEEPRRVAD
jgi:molybdopterin-synthase adenylyltransferase